MLLLVLYILYQVAVSQCSLNLAKQDQKTNINYCGQIGSCKPGEHVMCMYYRNESTMAPKCTGERIELKEEYRKQILSKINEMRARITYGNLTAQNNEVLPRGYGLKDLEWDDELARFAQVWANQCIFGDGDLCRATERFPNPGQFMGGIRYSYPNFGELGISKVLKKSKQMTEQKASSIIETVLDTVQNTRFFVTADMIRKHVGTGRNNLFLLTAYGGTTHIGCAMSYWVSHPADKKKYINYSLYSAALVCNLSAQPVEGQKVYETVPKSFQLSGSKAQRTKQKNTTKKTLTRRLGCNHNPNVELPSMVLMPVIKIDEKSLTDDQGKLTKPPTAIKRSKKVKASTVTPKNSVVIKRKFKTTSRPKKQKAESTNNKNKSKYVTQPPSRRDSETNKQRMFVVKDRYFNRKLKDSGQGDLNDGTLKPDSKESNKKSLPAKHDSIFARVSKFELPSQRNNNNQKRITHVAENSFRRQSNTSQKLSSKDLSRLEELVSEYFVKKQSRPDNSPVNIMNPLINTLMQFLDNYPTDNSIDAVNPHNQRLRELKALNNLEYNNLNGNNRFSSAEVDEKLLNFMYNLVQASGVDFNEIIEATTRIIQGDRAGKEWSQSNKRILDKEPSNIDARPVKPESEFIPLATRKLNPLVSHGKEIFGNIKDDNQKVSKTNELPWFKNNVHGAEDLHSLRNIDGRPNLFDKHNMNYFYAITDDATAKRISYFPENIKAFERPARNRRYYRRHNHIDLRPLFRPVINIR